MGKTRGRVALTQETYHKLIELFRERPGVISYAAAGASCSWQLAKRVWSGPPYSYYPWAIPASQVFEEEKAIAMARARAEEHARIVEAERARIAQYEAAREEEIEILKQENLLLKGARGDVIQAVALVADLVPAMRVLADVVKAECKRAPDGSLPKIDVVRAMSLLGRHALMTQRAVAAANAVLDQGKVTRGEPTSILGIKPVTGPTSYDEALAELEEVPVLLERARELGAPVRGVLETQAEPAPPPAQVPRGAGSGNGRAFPKGNAGGRVPEAPAATGSD